MVFGSEYWLEFLSNLGTLEAEILFINESINHSNMLRLQYNH